MEISTVFPTAVQFGMTISTNFSEKYEGEQRRSGYYCSRSSSLHQHLHLPQAPGSLTLVQAKSCLASWSERLEVNREITAAAINPSVKRLTTVYSSFILLWLTAVNATNTSNDTQSGSNSSLTVPTSFKMRQLVSEYQFSFSHTSLHIHGKTWFSSFLPRNAKQKLSLYLGKKR